MLWLENTFHPKQNQTLFNGELTDHIRLHICFSSVTTIVDVYIWVTLKSQICQTMLENR